MSGIERIAKERQRQIDVEGWTPEHDDQYKRGELIAAAECYTHFAERVRGAKSMEARCVLTSIGPPKNWPWSKDWWKPSINPIRNLEKAGALIAAEIDRLERLQKRKSKVVVSYQTEELKTDDVDVGDDQCDDTCKTDWLDEGEGQ